MKRVVAVLLLVAACATNKPPSVEERERCAEAREHEIKLELASAVAHGAELSDEIAEAHRDAMRDALGDEYLDGCETRGELWTDCALRAADLEALAACDAAVQP